MKPDRLLAEQVLKEVRKQVIGKDEILEQVLCALLAKGHILIEDTPGLGKTTMAMAFAKTMSLSQTRLQFTPDVMPSDILGFTMIDPKTQEQVFRPGPLFTNLFLADEINRTSPKTQSALLEVMEEGRISVDGATYQLEKPFMVIATQNPFGSAGTQPLPESQLDRFMIRISMGYPTKADEAEMLRLKHVEFKPEPPKPVMDAAAIVSMQETVEGIFVHNAIYSYIVALIDATRHHEMIAQGVSPRGSISLARMAQAKAFLSDRDYVVPEDVQSVFTIVTSHRVTLTMKARAAHQDRESILRSLLSQVPAPKSVFMR